MIKRLRKFYFRVVSSIAFYTVLLALFFLLLSWVMLQLDFSAWGTAVKSQWHWLRLKDPTTARTVASTVVGGIISLTVFSFSMVMIILVGAASQMSNRTLDSMIGNRFQQIVLGFYLGTIVYALFLLSSIRDIDSGVHVPALSVYLLIFLAVADLFLFIYFLHYVTQTVKYGTIIDRIHAQTKKRLQQSIDERSNTAGETAAADGAERHPVLMPGSDYFQGFHKKGLLRWAGKHNAVVEFLFPVGTYVLEGTPVLHLAAPQKPDTEECKELFESVDFFGSQSPDHHWYYGFLHLAEVAIKALSPGINDPSTAVLSLNALADLFALRLQLPDLDVCVDENRQPRIITAERSFAELFEKCIDPIWHYGNKDPFIRTALHELLIQLRYLAPPAAAAKMLARLQQQLDIAENTSPV